MDLSNLTPDRYVGSALIGAANEAAARYRDSSGDKAVQQEVYVGLMALAIIGIPILAAQPWKGSYIVGAAEGAFDGLAALAFRNVTRQVLEESPDTCHVPF